MKDICIYNRGKGSVPKWKASAYNVLCHTENGKLLIFNCFSGALVQIPPAEEAYVIKVLEGKSNAEISGIISILIKNGIIVLEKTNEFKKLQQFYRYFYEDSDNLHLIVLPTEKCNFRCIYCYESFKNGRMSIEVIESLLQFIKKEIKKLHSLSISWFGGEPLLALDLIEYASDKIIELCEKNRVVYKANLTTNGFLLTNQVVKRCIRVGISRFQITIDGPPETHNNFRKLSNGLGTYEKIIENLENIKNLNEDFHIRIRVNFNLGTVEKIPELIENLGIKFGKDSRFSIYFRGIGDWQTNNKQRILNCNQDAIDKYEIFFMSLALKNGFALNSWKEIIQIFGCICYAALPNSFVVDSCGKVYKCTIAFQDPHNNLGNILKKGILNIDIKLLQQWTIATNEITNDCKICALLPLCLGKSCPLSNFNKKEKNCPTIKKYIKEYLPVLASEIINT